MAEISKITLPSGNTYDIKDATARQMIAGGVSFIVAWNGSSTPVPASIPAGVVVTYNDTEYTGTLAATAAQAGAFYLVKSSTQKGTLDVYDEYAVIKAGSTKSWEKLGDTQLDLSDLGALAYKDNVTLNKGTGDNVLGSDATFTTTVTPTTTNIKATASGVAVGANGTDTFVKSYPGTTGHLAAISNVLPVTANSDVSIPNVTSAGSASTWAFSMGTGNDSETLIISGANGSAATLGTSLSASKVTTGESTTMATGAIRSGTSALGDVLIGLGTATTASALTGVKVTSQPTVSLATGATAGTGVISVATGITSATTTTNNKDQVKVAKYDDLSVTTS